MSKRVVCALLLPALACLLLACTKTDPLYCDEQYPCTDQDRPFCDLQGEYPASEGVARTCIPTPEGADGDGSDRDAASNENDAGPGSGDAAAADAMPPCTSWSAPVIVAGVNSTGMDGWASESPDRLSLYFTRDTDRSPDRDIFVARRNSPGEAFSSPSLVPELDEVFVFNDSPELSASGLELFFRRDGTSSTQGAIFVATRETVDDGFGEPQSLGVDGLEPSISGDGLTLYFVPEAGGRLMAMSRNAIGGVWGPPREVMATTYNEIDVSADELRILLSEGPDVSEGQPPVAIAERASKDDAFGEPVPIDALALPDDESPLKSASWADDERAIYLTMNLPTGQGSLDIYFSTCE
jgi:hypothetical protein